MKTFLDLLRHSLLAIVFHIAPRFANVLIFILLGRLAGPEQAGVFSLATTYLLIITTIMRGLDDLVTRQIAREPDQAARYFGNFLLLRLIMSTLMYLMLIMILQGGLNYPPATLIPIMILALSVVPDSLAFGAQAVLLGLHRFGPPAAVHGSANLLKLMIGAAILWAGGDLIKVAWIWLGGSIFGMLLMLIVTFKQVGGLRRVSWLDFAPLKGQWRAAFVFTMITMLTALDSQTDTVLLSVFRTEAEVGWYGAATTITFSLVMLSQAYRFAVYPQMTRYAHNTPDKLNPLFQKSVHYMIVLVMPMVVGIILLAPQIVNLVFGPKFVPTIPVLRILVLSLLFIFIGEPINRLLLVMDKHGKSVMFLFVGASVNVMLNLLLIPSLGASGSALARTISTGIYFILILFYVLYLGVSFPSVSFLFRIMISVMIMIIPVVILSQNLFFSIGVGMVVYVLCIIGFKGINPSDLQLLRNAVHVRSREKA